MSIQQAGFTAANIAEVDSNHNLFIRGGLPAHPAAGGYYSVTGGSIAIVAAALAANTPLMTMRLAVASIRKAYIQRVDLILSPATVGASAGVAGAIGLQRFTAATPTGGTARTANEQNEPLATATDVTDIRDSNAALTVTSVVFGAVVASTLVPLFTSGGSHLWVPIFDYPLVLQPGDGLSLRTTVAMAATQTWVYTYNVYWREE